MFLTKKERELESYIIHGFDNYPEEWRVSTGRRGSLGASNYSLKIFVDKRHSESRATIAIGGSYLNNPSFYASRRFTNRFRSFVRKRVREEYNKWEQVHNLNKLATVANAIDSFWGKLQNKIFAING